MATFTDNSGSTFINPNVCRSFNQVLTTGLSALSAQICSEVIVVNKTGQEVFVFDSGYSAAGNGILLDDNDTFTFRGITNSSQVSAKTATGSGVLYFRTQYFSYNPSR